jgi:Uma2 family endonuclease
MAATFITKRLLTAEEFARKYTDVFGVELVRGEVVKTPPAGWGHSVGNSNAHGMLYMWARRTGAGRVLTGEFGIVTERQPDTLRGADTVYYSFQRLPRGAEPPGFASVPPNLVVEVVGTGRSWKRLVKKAAEYLDMGVDRVWILDPKRKIMHIYRNEDEPPIQLSGDDEVRDETVLPGFSCRVSDFFE